MPSRIDLLDASGYLDLPETADGYTGVITLRRPDGSTVWEARPPEGDKDAWVSVSIAGQRVIANSWSCWRLSYDLASGVERDRHLTK